MNARPDALETLLAPQLRVDEDTRRAQPTGPVGREVDSVIDHAIRRRASDVHIDPVSGGTRCRIRVDGMFEPGRAITPGLHARVVARIKVLAGLTVYRSDLVQEGAIRRDGGVDLRVSVIPTVAGEKITIRVFDPSCRPFQIDDLGFDSDAARRLERCAGLRDGLIVLAGPSGSGKTTTAYAMLRGILDRRGEWTNACSVEDPVEFALDGVHQVPVNRTRDLAFARALSALLRQDPEVLLIGEVRDVETARIAVEAGMTGHLVITSVHASSAREARARFEDLGVDRHALGSALRVAFAQRLLRAVCESCATPAAPDDALLRRFGVEAAGHWRTGAGCDRCRGTGWSGRFPVADWLDYAATASPVHVHPLPMDRAAVEAARRGRTTLDEVARVLGPPDGDER